jgi:hypothetical protein
LAYIGNTPAESYASFLTETFTVSATASYTLSHAVANENDIRLVINGVVQQPGSGKAYTASGTTLTLTSATVSGDVMYAVYLGRALQTVNPPNASVGTAQLASEAVTNAKVASSIITGQTAETSIATDDLILLSDTSASGALKKMTRANFVSGVGGTNTPAFYVKSNNTVNVATATHTQITYDTEVFDTDNAFASNAFTVPSGEGGKYVLYALAGRQGWDSDRFLIYIYKGGSTELSVGESAINTTGYHTTDTFCIADLSAGDVITVQVYHDSGSTRGLSVGQRCVFKGFKLL